MKLSVKDLLAIGFQEAVNFDRLTGATFCGVSTDSRSVRREEVFVALRGEKYDGHAFIEEAFDAGAACAIIDRQAAPRPRLSRRPHLVVSDTLKALGDLAHRYRAKFAIPVIAVAGSNGKTTTKEMITAVLNERYTVLSTEGNLNNQIGVPQTLFRLEKKHDAAVIEIGTNHPGEIAALCEILDPTHGVITNIGREHLQYFGNLRGVAAEEGKLFAALRSRGIGFINGDDRHLTALGRRLKRKVTYGFTKPRADIRGKFLGLDEQARASFSVQMRGRQPFAVQLGVAGKFAMQNALAAAAIGLTFGVPQSKIGRSLREFRAFGKRMEVVTVGGITILNDTYNANTDSMLSSLETLGAMRCGGKKIAVLADMLELGDAAAAEHARIGRAAGKLGVQHLLTFGPLSRTIYAQAKVPVKLHYENKINLGQYISEISCPGDIILVKGSRGMRMEEIVNYLINHLKVNAA